MVVAAAVDMAEANYIATVAMTGAKTNITLSIRFNVLPPPCNLYGL
jgi:hypothetical protein